MSEADGKYTEADIKLITARESIRLRPNMYLGSVEQEGLHNLVGELIDSAVASHRYDSATTITCTLHQDGSISIIHDGTGVPVDVINEKSALEVLFTNLHAGGTQRRSPAYDSTYGFVVAAALCNRCEVESRIDGHAWRIVFSEGSVVEPLVRIGATSESGLRIRFLPDPTIFDSARFDGIRLRRDLRECAALVPGIRIAFRDEMLGHDDEFCFPDGVQTLLQDLLPGTAAVLTKPLHVRARLNDIHLEFAAQYITDGETVVESYVNLRRTQEHGTHVSGSLTGLKTAVQQIPQIPRREHAAKITRRQSQSGLRAIVALELPHPQFEGAARTKLINAEMKNWCETTVLIGLSAQFHEGWLDAQRLLTHFQPAAET